MATYTTTSGAALGDIPLSTLMVDKDAVVSIVSGSASGVVDTVSGMIATAVSTAWKAGGSKAPMDLTSSLLVAANEGKVYNMSASGTTDSNFMEGAGKSYAAGTDIAVINDGTAESPVYKFNVLATYDASVVKSITVGASTITPALNGSITFSGTNGVSVHSGGGATVTIDGSGLSGIISGIGSGLDVVSGVASGAASGLSGLKNFSGVHVHSGSGDTGYTPISATSNADTLALKAGSNVTLVPNTSDKSVTINATAAPESSGFAHVTNGSGTIDADSAADTLTVSGTAPIDISLDTTNDKVTFSHATCGPSSSGSTSKGDTTAQSPGFGGTFKALSATVDKHGHVTALGEHNVTIPSAVAVATGSSGAKNGLMSSGDKYKLDNMSSGANIGFNAVNGTDGTLKSIVDGDALLVMSGTNISASVSMTSGSTGSVVLHLSVPDASTTAKGVVELASSLSETGSVVPTAAQVSGAIAGITHPVTGAKISGASSNLTISGTTIVIPVASTSAKGVTQLTDSVSNSTTTAITPNAVSGAISGVNSGLATKVSGGSLHTALSGSGLANGVGSGNNTIYALINALHSVDGQSES